jgi:hypothetical protein
MEVWEFLLQKDGDRSWLPLESPTVEVLEGRYRLIARTSRRNTPAEVRLTYQADDDNSINLRQDYSKCQIQKWNRQTNAAGLIMILPFSYLKPGLWDLRCTADLISDFLGEGWSYRIQLQVLADNDELLEDWGAPESGLSTEFLELTGDSTEHIPDSGNVEVLDILPEPATEFAPLFEAEDFQVKDPFPMDAIAASSADSSALDLTAPVSEYLEYLEAVVDQVADGVLEEIPLTSECVDLTLEQETFATSRGQSLIVQGCVDLNLPLTAATTGALRLELGIFLRDPQNAEPLLEVRHHLPEQFPQIPFAYEVDVPLHCTTHLLLGEVILYKLALGQESPHVLATCSFTIAANLDEIFQDIWQRQQQLHRDETEDVAPAAEQVGYAIATPADSTALPSSLSEKLDLALFELVKNPTRVKLLDLQPLQEWTAPPRIYNPEPHAWSQRPLQLPSLPCISEAIAGEPDQASEHLCSTAKTEVAATPSVIRTLERLSQAVNISAIEFVESSEWVNNFQTLPLQQRFWSRLTAFAKDSECEKL